MYGMTELNIFTKKRNAKNRVNESDNKQQTASRVKTHYKEREKAGTNIQQGRGGKNKGHEESV